MATIFLHGDGAPQARIEAYGVRHDLVIGRGGDSVFLSHLPLEAIDALGEQLKAIVRERQESLQGGSAADSQQPAELPT